MHPNTEQVWLSRDAHERVAGELAALLAEREDGTSDTDDVNAQEQREMRIRHLQDVVRSAVVHEPPDDGVAEPGMVLTVRFDGDDDTETFLLGGREGAAASGDLELCSPRSPLGRALTGAVGGEQREYAAPDGTWMRVTLVSAVPHRSTIAG